MFISHTNKLRWLSDRGYVVFYHERSNTDPQQLKHLLRESAPGWYVALLYTKKPRVLNLGAPVITEAESYAVHVLFYQAVVDSLTEHFTISRKDGKIQVFQPEFETPVYTADNEQELVENFATRLALLDGYYEHNMPNISDIGEVGVPTVFTPIYTPTGALVALVVRKEDAKLLQLASEMYRYVAHMAETTSAYSEDAKYLLARL